MRRKPKTPILTCNATALRIFTVYNKIFTRILDSSIWLESDSTRIVWLTLLAAMDENGFAQFAAVGNVANRARVEESKAREAIERLSSPDPDSSDPENGGRRIERVPGGWLVLNAVKYREIVTRAISQEQVRSRVAKFRAKAKDVTNSNGHVTGANARVTPSEAGSGSKSETNLAPAAPARGRNPLIDALAEAEGTPLDAITKSVAGRLGAALKEIRESNPGVTADEIARRARLYPHKVLTAGALAKWWGKCGGFPKGVSRGKGDPYKEPVGWKERLPSLPYNQDTLAEMATGGWLNMPIYVREALAR